jgi:hypothetical protein
MTFIIFKKEELLEDNDYYITERRKNDDYYIRGILCHFHFRAGNASSGAKGPIKLCIH